MFEKEAKEYADNVYGNRTEIDHYGIADAFQDGADFGYNKANEWYDLKIKQPPLRKEVLWSVDEKLWLGELLETRIDFDEWELDSVLFNDYEIYWKEPVFPKGDKRK